MLELNDLLQKAGIDPTDVLVMRHRPFEPELRRVFAWIAADRPDLFRAYQASQFVHAEKALLRAKYMVSLIGLRPRRAVFATLYSVGATRSLTSEEFWTIPENNELSSLGMTGWSENDTRPSVLWFDLQDAN